MAIRKNAGRQSRRFIGEGTRKDISSRLNWLGAKTKQFQLLVVVQFENFFTGLNDAVDVSAKKLCRGMTHVL